MLLNSHINTYNVNYLYKLRYINNSVIDIIFTLENMS